MSPSTRRAWIEIKGIDLSEHQGTVALHPEGVDRNRDARNEIIYTVLSPSTRRAWIEILVAL